MKINEENNTVLMMKSGVAIEVSPYFGKMTIKRAFEKLQEMNSNLSDGEIPWRFAGGETFEAMRSEGISFNSGSYIKSKEVIEWSPGGTHWRELAEAREGNYTPYTFYFTNASKGSSYGTWSAGNEEKEETHVRFARVTPGGSFKTWRTTTIGGSPHTDKSPEKLLEDSGCSITDSARQMLRSCTLHTESVEREVDLVVVSGESVGFSGPVGREQVYDRVKILGLKPCPDEIILRLCIEQPTEQGSWSHEIGTRPLVREKYDPDTLVVSSSDGKTKLRVPGRVHGYLGHVRYVQETFVFEKPRN